MVMPDPGLILPGEPGFKEAATGRPRIPIGEVFIPEEALNTLGITMQKYLKDFASDLGTFFGDELKKELEGTFETLKEISKTTIKEISDAQADMSDDLANRTTAAMQQMTKEQIQSAEEVIKKAQATAEQEQYKIQLRAWQYQVHPEMRTAALAQLNPVANPLTGQVEVTVGNQTVPINQITNQQLAQAQMTGQMMPQRGMPQRQPMMQRLAGGVQTMAGAVMPVISPISQAIGTIAPNEMERFQIGAGLMQQTFGTMAGIGQALSGLSVATGAGGGLIAGGAGAIGGAAGAAGGAAGAAGGIMGTLGAVGGVLGPIGMGLGAIAGIVTPIVEGILRRNREREEREYRYAGGGGGRSEEYRKMYEVFANKWDPAVPKQEIDQLIESLVNLGETGVAVAHDIKYGGEAMEKFGLSVQDWTRRVSMAQEIFGYGTEVSYSALAFQSISAPGTMLSLQERAKAEMAVQQAGMEAGWMGEENVQKLSSIMTDALSGIKSGEVLQQVINSMLDPMKQLMIFGNRDPSQMSSQDVMVALQQFVRKYTKGRKADQIGQTTKIALAQAMGVPGVAVNELANWASQGEGEIREQVAGAEQLYDITQEKGFAEQFTQLQAFMGTNPQLAQKAFGQMQMAEAQGMMPTQEQLMAMPPEKRREAMMIQAWYEQEKGKQEGTKTQVEIMLKGEAKNLFTAFVNEGNWSAAQALGAMPAGMTPEGLALSQTGKLSGSGYEFLGR